MEKQFSSDNVYEFMKTLVEIGGVYFVDNQHCLCHTEDRSPVGVKIGEGANSRKMICLFKEGERPPENAVYLNPFVELIGSHPELDKFNTIIGVLPGCLTLKTMIDITELILSKKEDTKFKKAASISKFVGKVDEKFLNELQKIRPVDAGCIAYDSKKYVAQLQCYMLTDEWVEDNKSKFRKSSVKTIQEMAAAIYGTETPHSVVYTGTLPPCKRFDATIHVLAKYLEMAAPMVEPFTGIELHVDEIKEHVEQLPAYHKAMQWLATSTSSPQKSTTVLDKMVASKHAVPWNTGVASPAAKVSPVVDRKDIFAHAGAVGAVKNPTYGGFGMGSVVNPTFGMGGGFGNPGFGMNNLGSVSSVRPVVPQVSFADLANPNPMGSMNFGTSFPI